MRRLCKLKWYLLSSLFLFRHEEVPFAADIMTLFMPKFYARKVFFPYSPLLLWVPYHILTRLRLLHNILTINFLFKKCVALRTFFPFGLYIFNLCITIRMPHTKIHENKRFCLPLFSFQRFTVYVKVITFLKPFALTQRIDCVHNADDAGSLERLQFRSVEAQHEIFHQWFYHSCVCVRSVYTFFYL